MNENQDRCGYTSICRLVHLEKATKQVSQAFELKASVHQSKAKILQEKCIIELHSQYLSKLQKVSRSAS